MFRSNQRAFYQHFRSSSGTITGKPLLPDLTTFWKEIFEKESHTNLQAPWLSQLREQFVESSFTQSAVCIDSSVFTSTLKLLRNWTSPGLDGIQGFWWKRFGSVHTYLCQKFDDFFTM